jgi:hypothetical protein
VVEWFEVLSLHLSGGTEKTHEQLNNYILSPGLDLKPWPLSRKECYPFDSDVRWPFKEDWWLHLRADLTSSKFTFPLQLFYDCWFWVWTEIFFLHIICGLKLCFLRNWAAIQIKVYIIFIVESVTYIWLGNYVLDSKFLEPVKLFIVGISGFLDYFLIRCNVENILIHSTTSLLNCIPLPQ